MTVLHRTDLTTSQKIECAAAAVARQYEHGSKTALSETYEISRPTVYAVGATAESVLRTHFEAPLLGDAGVEVRVDDAQLRRAVVALRVVAPNAIRPIEDLPLYLVGSPRDLTELFRRRISWDDGVIRDTSDRSEVAFFMNDCCRSGGDGVARAASVGKGCASAAHLSMPCPHGP